MAGFLAALAGAFFAAGFAAAFLTGFAFGNGSSITLRKSISMSYQPMSLSRPSNSTSARPLMFTVRTVPVNPLNRRSSGRVSSTTTYLSVYSDLRRSICSKTIGSLMPHGWGVSGTGARKANALKRSVKTRILSAKKLKSKAPTDWLKKSVRPFGER